MKIKLIAPHEQREDNISSAETFKIQEVNLPLLAALTPPEHTVKIVDEAFVPDDINDDVDLVGITVMTELALRAYQIADTYRQRGIQKLYCANKISDLNQIPIPRRDLYPKAGHKGYTPLAFGIETARGCPYDCEFCSIGSVMGRQYRSRPIPDVIAEIESIDSPHLFFVDDALALNRVTAKKLFTEMIPLRRKWAGQGTVSLAEDVELLKSMKRSGCAGLLIGFESVQKETQDGMKKIRNLKIDFSEAMRRFHGEGLAILAAFIFGFDHENKDVFDQTFELTMRNRLDCVELRIVTPYPGTRLHRRLLKENRLFVPDWWLHGYPPDTLLFQPKGMTAEELIEGFARLNHQTYSFGSIIKRFFGITPWKRTAIGCWTYAGVNLATRKRYFKELDIPQPFVGTLDSESTKLVMAR